MIVVAVLHKEDLVSTDYYEREIGYQGQIEQLARTQRLLPLASIRYDADRACIQVNLPGFSSGAEPTGRIQLYRPSSAALDRGFALAPGADGIQLIDARKLSPGLWKVRVQWRTGGQSYFLDERVLVTAKPT